MIKFITTAHKCIIFHKSSLLRLMDGTFEMYKKCNLSSGPPYGVWPPPNIVCHNPMGNCMIWKRLRFLSNFHANPRNGRRGASLEFQQEWITRPLAPNYMPEEDVCRATEALIGSAEVFSYRPERNDGRWWCRGDHYAKRRSLAQKDLNWLAVSVRDVSHLHGSMWIMEWK